MTDNGIGTVGDLLAALADHVPATPSDSPPKPAT